MKIALIADIHGNLAAFEAVLAAIGVEQPEQIVCLGDVAATGPQPRRVIARLRELGCAVVMGNADAELLAPTTADDAPDETMRKILQISQWAADQLDAADRAYLASFQPTVSIDLGAAGQLLCCHGSPRSFNDMILTTTPDDDLEPMLGGSDAPFLAGGHTHFRMLRTWRNREIINPGSVGLAYQRLPDGDVRMPPWAEFALLSSGDEGTMSVGFRRVPYDRAATVRAMHDQGMPHAAWWAERWQ